MLVPWILRVIPPPPGVKPPPPFHTKKKQPTALLLFITNWPLTHDTSGDSFLILLVSKNFSNISPGTYPKPSTKNLWRNAWIIWGLKGEGYVVPFRVWPGLLLFMLGFRSRDSHLAISSSHFSKGRWMDESAGTHTVWAIHSKSLPWMVRPFRVGFPYCSLPFGVTTRRFGRYKLPSCLIIQSQKLLPKSPGIQAPRRPIHPLLNHETFRTHDFGFPLGPAPWGYDLYPPVPPELRACSSRP